MASPRDTPAMSTGVPRRPPGGSPEPEKRSATLVTGAAWQPRAFHLDSGAAMTPGD